MSFTARFSGTPCDSCEEPVKEGQEVEYNAANRLVHAVCPETLDVAHGEVCGSCFMEKSVSGRCDNCE
jgi:hypothetical protein